MKLKLWPILAALLLSSTAYSQLTPDLAAKLESQKNLQITSSAIHSNDYILRGVDKKLAGNDFVYSFPVKGIRNSMLVRATDGTQSIEWLTEPMPKSIGSAEYANFVIPVGVGINSRYFTVSLEIDGKEAFVIDNTDLARWRKSDSEGRTLDFESVFVDANRDRRGFLYLRIPKDKLPAAGSSLQLKLTADKRGTQAWYMVFTDQIVESSKVKLSPAIAEGKQQLLIEHTHFGAPEETTVKLDGKVIDARKVTMGDNFFTVSIDKVAKSKNSMVEIAKNGKTEKIKVRLEPSRNWELFFVQHTHTDIGYTRPQNEILAEHIRYIDYALDYCDLTDGYEPSAQFHWVCESTWAVEQFLQTRPQQQIDRLKKRIEEGRIEVSGAIFNFSELPDEQTLVASLKPLVECRKSGIPVEIAMQNDVNGMAWAFADYLPQLGVKYLNMGTHGHRALICFDYPTVFRWKSPSGSEMIAYRAEHYNTGNFFGVERSNFEEFESRVLTYLIELQEKGYPYDIASIQFSGYFTDNSPPSIAACSNIQKWNEKYSTPHLRLSTTGAFLKKVEEEHYATLPVLKQAWPDWWTDGFGAAARETAVSRYAKTDIMANQTLLSMAALQGAHIPQATYQTIDQVNRAILFYDEHTTGYSESVRNPWCKASMDQRALKESYAWEAYRNSRTLSETALGLLQAYTEKASVPSIIVYNTLNYSRTGIVECYIDNEILPREKEFTITDAETGKAVAVQPLNSRTEGTYWQIRVEDVPALGQKQLLIQVSDKEKAREIIEMEMDGHYENRFYSVQFDKAGGTIQSLRDKELGIELLNSHDGRNLGEFVYEKLAERGSMEAFTMGKHTREGLDSIWFVNLKRGAIYDSYNFSAQTVAGIESRGTNFSVEFRIHHEDKLIELCYSIVKKSVIEPEGVYIALPFALENANIYCEVPGGVMQAGADQIKGSSNDWNTHQNFVSVANQQAQIVVGSSEAPLMQFGAINTGRYKAGALPDSPNIYSWVMNNYWVTNFNAEQRGEFVWKYYITSIGNNSHAEATQFGWSQRVAMPTRVLPAQLNAPSKLMNAAPVLELKGGEFILINAAPVEGERAILLQIREIGGKDCTLDIPNYTYSACNAIGEKLPLSTPLHVKANSTCFVKLGY
ncbi:MAG: glycosyl hydrolase family 38 [Phocaeicola sp.]